MQGQYATIEVRESISFIAAHCTAQETAQILNKCAPFKPSATAIKNIIEEVGTVLVEHSEAIQQQILSKETILAQAQVIVVSMDRANVLLREKGTCKHLPAERPVKTIADKEAESCYYSGRHLR